MSILSGFKKYKNYIKTDSGYQLSSLWTKSDAVIMGDGTDDTNTLEKKCGAIKGISSSTTLTSSGFAADQAALNERLNALQSDITSNMSCTKEFSGSVTIAKSGTATITLPLESGYSYFLMIRGVDNVAWNGAYIIHTGKASKTMVSLSATYNVTATLSNTTLTIKNGDVTYSQELAVELLKL